MYLDKKSEWAVKIKKDAGKNWKIWGENGDRSKIMENLSCQHW